MNELMSAIHVDAELFDRRLAEVSRRLVAHAGGVELVDLTADGRVLLKYTGLCTGCPYRPLTSAVTVRPMLMQVPGITAVEIQGSRISEEAERRLADHLSACAPNLSVGAGGRELDSPR